MNSEGYSDPTAEKAIRNAERTPQYVMDVIEALRTVASLSGFEVIGRIKLRDTVTGKEYR